MSSRSGGATRRGMAGSDKPVAATPRASVTVDVEPEAREALAGMFGRALSDAEIASLVGAQPGDHVQAATNLFGDVDLGLDGSAHADRTISGSPGRVTIHNESISMDVRRQRQGMGTRIFATQAHAASRLGVREIYTTAARGTEGLNGYYTWPRLGYNGPFNYASWMGDRMPESAVPESVKHANDFHDLMRTAEGREWWSENGADVHLTFDTRPGSRSMQVLDAYLKERGIKIP